MSINQPVFHYKSAVTLQKLQDFQSRPLDPFDLEKIDQFEEKFKQFSLKFQQEAFPESYHEDKSRLQKRKTIFKKFPSQDSLATNTITLTQHGLPTNNSSILKKQKSQKHNKTQSLVSFEEPQTTALNQSHHHSKKDQQLNGLIDQKFKLMLQKNSQKENPVVQYFGNQLIATVFQSLIIKTIEEKFHIKINMDCDIPISSNVLKMFDLSTVVINNLKGYDNKMDYIYSTMSKKIDSLLSNFEEKSRQKEVFLQKQEEKLNSQNKSVQPDHFTWLKLKASHETLKKKLRQMIVEKLIEYENLLKIEEVIQKKQNLKDEGKLDEASKTFGELKNLKLTSSKEVFKNMSTYGNHNIKLYLSRLGITKYPDEKHPTSKINKKNKRCNSEDQIFVNLKNQDSTNANQLNTTKLLNRKSGIKGFQNEEIAEDNFWTQEREDEFQKYRSQKKFIYSNEVVSSNWNDVGFLPFVQRYLLEYKKSIHRDTLLDRYKGGEQLSEEELRFLANTSELLNSCVDKNFMQKAVNIVNPDLIDNMELGLAEQILSNYEDAKLAIKKARQNFIHEKQEKQQEWLRDQDEKALNQRKKIQNAQFYRRYYRIFTVLLDKMEREQKFADKLPENIHGAEYLNQYLLGNTSEKDTIEKIYKIGKLTEYEFKRYIERKKQEKEEKEESQQQANRFKQLSKPISYTNDEFIKNMKRRKYHPSSKIFIEKHNQSSDDEIRRDLTIEQQEQKRYNAMKKNLIKKQEIEKYELNLKTIDLLKDKQNFKTFYSGGPQKQQNHLTIYERYRATGKNIATQQEMRSILIIQKRFRAFLKRKQLIQFIRANKIKKDYQYKNIIDQIQMNPTQIHLRIKETFDPAKPSIDDIQLQISKKHHSQYIRGSLLKNMSRSNSMISIKGGADKSFTFMSQKHSRNPSLNILVPQNQIQNNQDQNKSPLTEKISPIVEKIGHLNPSTPINQNKSPDNQFVRSNSGHNSQRFIQLNQGGTHYFSSYVKMQQEMAETHKRIQAQSASPNYIQQSKTKSEFNDNQQEAISTQFSTNKKLDHTFTNQFSHFADNNHNKEFLNSKKSMRSDEDEDESGDKCDVDFQRTNNHSQSPSIKINQQTFNNNLYQQKRASLLFKIPSSAVKINKYIDTKNVMQQFALKELLLPKTPKENLLLSNKNLQQKTNASKITDAFSKKQNESIHPTNKVDHSYSQLISHNNSSLPSTQISQFFFQSPTSSTHLSQKASDQAQSQIQFSSNLSMKQIDNTFQPSHENSSEQQDANNSSMSSDHIANVPPNKIPDIQELDPPINQQRPTIKQQRLLAAAAENKLQLILNSGFIFYENDISVRDMYGNTPLHLAIKNIHFEFALWLLSKKANPNLRNNQGLTPLHFAFQTNKLEAVMLIYTHGGDLNILNKKGETPLALGSQKLLSMLGLQKGVVTVRQDEDSFKIGYLNSFNNNTLLEKKCKQTEFMNQYAEFQMKKLKSNFSKIVADKNVNSFN